MLLRGLPAEPRRVGGPLNDLRENKAARDTAVAGHERVSAGQRWIHWIGEDLKYTDTTFR